MKTSELTGAALDWALAKSKYPKLSMDGLIRIVTKGEYNPSTDWSQGGPIIEREKIDLKWVGADKCRAAIDWLDEEFYEAFGPTPLIAAMRCLVASKLGDEVEIPKELTA